MKEKDLPESLTSPVGQSQSSKVLERRPPSCAPGTGSHTTDTAKTGTTPAANTQSGTKSSWWHRIGESLSMGTMTCPELDSSPLLMPWVATAFGTGIVPSYQFTTNPSADLAGTTEALRVSVAPDGAATGAVSSAYKGFSEAKYRLDSEKDSQGKGVPMISQEAQAEISDEKAE
ncbi:hypothetical protein IAT40_007290 [Kwoniella sp. CBS 6097]